MSILCCENVISITILISVASRPCWANSTISDIERLFNETILATDHRYRPSLNQSEPTCVYLSLMLLSLADFDEVRQSMSGNVQLTVTWIDETRKWNPVEYGGLTQVHPDRLDIWRPRLFLSNSIAKRDMFDDDYAPLTIYSNGLTKWRPGGILNTFCPMKMTHFPFDTQTCTLNFTTAENTDTLELLAYSRNVSLSNYDIHGEWLIDNSEAQSLIVADKSAVQFILKLRRMSSFALLNIVIPVNIISSLSSLTFIMPANSGERVSFSITVLLSLTVYTGEISESLPTNSESLPLLIMYLTCLLLHSGLGIVVNLVMLIRYHASRKVSELDGRTTHIKLSDSDSSAQCVPITAESFFSFENKSVPKQNPISHKNDLRKSKKSTLSNRRSRGHELLKKRKDYMKFGESLVKDGSDNKQTEKCAERIGNEGSPGLSPVLSCISSVDLVLFVFFGGLWLVITVVFMILIASGGE